MPACDNENFSTDAHLSMVCCGVVWWPRPGVSRLRMMRRLLDARRAAVVASASFGRHRPAQAIGGASSFFVGTDVAYLGGEGNFLRPIVGVEDIDSDIVGICKAGTSTAMGFAAFQTVQNVTYKQGQAWLD